MVQEVQEVAACITRKSSLCECSGHIGEPLKLSCGHEVPMISAACTIGKRMPVSDGYVGDQSVKVLRDSGCSTVVVKRDLVKDEQLLDSTQKCVLLDGTARNVPVARIQIDSPYFVGTVNALCMTNPLYDLILGNIAGVKDPRDPDPNWSPLTKCVNQNHEESQILPNEVTAVVETRAQKLRKAKDLRPLRVPEAENLSESREEIVTAQHEDPALDKLWTLAEKGQSRKTGKGNESRYVVSDELLFREFTSPTVENGRVLKQLVLPKKLHSKQSN